MIENFDPLAEAQASLARGAELADAEDAVGARQALDDAIHRAMEAGDLRLEAEAWFQLAMASFDSGLSKDGHDALLESMALYRDIADVSPDDSENKRCLARAIRVYGEHLGVLGGETDSRQALEIARLMYLDLDDPSAAESIERDVERLAEFAR